MIVASDLLSAVSGSLVGTVLGVLGGGGSILAVPLLVYVVGVASPHVAIGTSGLAVSASAVSNLIAHSRSRHVRWPCAIIFSIAGMGGASIGALAGKTLNGHSLLLVFGCVMIVVAALMIKRPPGQVPDFEPLCRKNAKTLVPRLTAVGAGVGLLSGLLGIGGGFLIVPGLMFAARMPAILAIGSSLLAVSLFGLTTALSYAISGLIDWRIAFWFIGGGVIGSFLGTEVATHLAHREKTLTRIFAFALTLVGAYIIVSSLSELLNSHRIS